MGQTTKPFQGSYLYFLSCWSLVPSWPGPKVPVSQDFVELSEAETALLSCSIVPWPLSLVCRKGGQGSASDTFRNSRTNTGIPARLFSLWETLDASQLLRIPQTLFFTLDHTLCVYPVIFNVWVWIVFLHECDYISNLVALFEFVEIQNQGCKLLIVKCVLKRFQSVNLWHSVTIRASAAPIVLEYPIPPSPHPPTHTVCPGILLQTSALKFQMS